MARPKPGMLHLTVLIDQDLHQHIAAAAGDADQTISAWVRQTILERLERFGRGSTRSSGGNSG